LRRPDGSGSEGLAASACASTSLVAATLGILLTLCVGGCPFLPSDTIDGEVPLLDEDGNSSFKTATSLPLQDDLAQFRGTIGSPVDVDIYNLGTLAPGDRLLVDVQRTSGNLDAMAVVFDYREYLHAFNDDRTPDASNLNPLIDIVIRGPEGTYYLGVVPLEGSGSVGEYKVSIEITRGVGVPEPTAQVVFLDWDGGQNVRVENVGTFNLDPFDAGDLGPYGGQTELMKDRIQQIVADRYEDFNLVLLNSDDDAVPTVPHTTVYFGGESFEAFGVSEQIDTFNADPTDDAIIFTGAYNDAFFRVPSFEQMATAVGNTVAHEIGHLLGLVHTTDCDSLMDSTCGNNSILSAQSFKLAELDDTIFPVGWQDARELLEWVLGLVGL
jgi:hypothetical protein